MLSLSPSRGVGTTNLSLSALRPFSTVRDEGGSGARSISKRSSSSSAGEADGEAAASASATPPVKSKTTTSASSSSAPVAAYLDLAKFRLSALVVATTGAGFVAAGGPIASQADVLAACVAGTALCSSSAAALNQIVEIEQDKRMKRTQQRPLVTGMLTVKQATTAAACWGTAGSLILYAGTDPITTALGVGNIVLYAGVYTSMKPKSIYNTWVGAVVGAIPPVMGYSAATGGAGVLDLQSMLLASALYLWQMPHFFALSFMHRVDYKRGGFQMVPCLEEDGQRTAELITRYTWYLSSVPFLATATGATSSMFAFEGLALNAYFLKQAYNFEKDRTNANARKVFLTSLWYLPCLLMLYLIHSKVWDKEELQEGKEEDFVAQWLSDTIHGIRERGRELCLHEFAVSKTPDGDSACPVTVTGRKSQEGVKVMSAAAAQVASATVDDASNEEETM